jgi:hypothetical protein|nr:MAG TPA: hypothetical protein [Caudoviricetes sp.]
MTNFLNQTRINHKGHPYEVTSFDPSTKRYTVFFPHNKVTKVVSSEGVRKNNVSEQPAKTTSYLNQTRINHNGFEYIPIEYNQTTKRFTVYFPHNNVTKEVGYMPVHRNVVSEKETFDKPAAPLETRIRELYHNMRRRLANRTSYADVKLDPRWETFEGFRKTIQQVEGFEQWSSSTGYSLDRDTKGMNTYGPESCVFITRSENSSLPRRVKRKPSECNSYSIGSKIDVHGQEAVVVGKLPLRTTIHFTETDETRTVWTISITLNQVAKSTKGK